MASLVSLVSLVSVTRDGAVAVLELQRKEKRNALNVALRDAIEGALRELAADDSVKVVVLTGGETMFCAGYDLAEMLATELASLFHRGHEYTSATLFFEKPVISAVAGFAIAGGFDLALSGDLVIAAEGAKLGRPEIAWGVNPLMTKLAMRIGAQRALAFSLRGAIVDAAEALSLGLIDRVVPASDLMAIARAEASTIARQPLHVLRATKRAAYKVGTLTPRDAIEYEFGVTAELVAEGTPKRSLEAYAKKVGVLD
jgi:enoyl-CoA hydratase